MALKKNKSKDIRESLIKLVATKSAKRKERKTVKQARRTALKALVDDKIANR